ncbi:hypothetical protein [Pseudobacter ginsenosidimutans]|nr:hypothetical protein [Pseudobacter ginsenosidimutans]
MKGITIISFLLLITAEVLAQGQADTSKGKGFSRSDIESGLYAGQ